MSMNVGSSDDGDDAVMSAINTTPLVDVMLGGPGGQHLLV
jgi:biopolymer transport protein ExbD